MNLTLCKKVNTSISQNVELFHTTIIIQGYLALRSADKVDGRPNPDSLGFGLLDCNLNGFGWDTWWNAKR